MEIRNFFLKFVNFILKYWLFYLFSKDRIPTNEFRLADTRFHSLGRNLCLYCYHLCTRTRTRTCGVLVGKKSE